MECINPTEVKEGDLLAYAAGDASPGVSDHVRRCAYCTAQVASYARLDSWLAAGLYRAACPSPAILARWQLRLLPADQELPVAAHVRSCPHCSRELGELAAVDDDLLSALLEKMHGVGRWLEASLVATAPSPSEVRGLFTAQRRYRAGDLEIFVGAQGGIGGRRLIGRLYLPAGQQAQIVDAPVCLAQGEHVLGSRTADDLGFFDFPDLASGTYDLGLSWNEQLVLIRGIEI